MECVHRRYEGAHQVWRHKWSQTEDPSVFPKIYHDLTCRKLRWPHQRAMCGYTLQLELVTICIPTSHMRSTAVSCPVEFSRKLNAMKELYFDDLVHLLQNKQHYQLTTQQTLQISVIVKLFCTPQTELQIPFSLTLLQAMEERVLLWLQQTIDC
mgnify:CR=1 FL=1